MFDDFFEMSIVEAGDDGAAPFDRKAGSTRDFFTGRAGFLTKARLSMTPDGDGFC